jgi:hypothetical protein
LEAGDHVVPENEAEKTCFDLLKDLDHVGGHVQGSMTSKKYMRNEVWSLIAFKGAPSWFITFSPVDNNHPLCLYFADDKIYFTPKIRNSDERMRLIAQNPVAAATFFDHMTRAFIEHVLCVDSNDPGLYGHTDSYYGTVEQQGCLTLHMHMLIWVKGALSPQEIRQKMVSEDGEFQKAMIAYLEAAHMGEFLTGTMAEVRTKVPYLPKQRQGMHVIIADDSAPSTPAGYTDPTQTVPEAPPPLLRLMVSPFLRTKWLGSSSPQMNDFFLPWSSFMFRDPPSKFSARSDYWTVSKNHLHRICPCIRVTKYGSTSVLCGNSGTALGTPHVACI